MDNQIKQTIEKYKAELNEVLGKMNNIKKEIKQLDSTGVELTTQANVLCGKIEGLEELQKANKANQPINEGVKDV